MKAKAIISTIVIKEIEFQPFLQVDFSNDWHVTVALESLKPGDVAEGLGRMARHLLRIEMSGELT